MAIWQYSFFLDMLIEHSQHMFESCLVFRELKSAMQTGAWMKL